LLISSLLVTPNSFAISYILFLGTLIPRLVFADTNSFKDYTR